MYTSFFVHPELDLRYDRMRHSLPPRPPRRRFGRRPAQRGKGRR